MGRHASPQPENERVSNGELSAGQTDVDTTGAEQTAAGRPGVRLVQLPPTAVDALAAGDLDAAREIVRLDLTEYFVDDDNLRLWNYRTTQLRDTPTDADWIARVAVTTPGDRVIGHAGFHSGPDESGTVEVAYRVDPEFRRQGYAREMLRLLLDRAASEPGVTTVRASIRPDNGASQATIAGFGFAQVGEQWDEIDGLEILWEVATPSPQPAQLQPEQPQTGNDMTSTDSITTSTAETVIHKGLAGVVVDTTSISKVNPETNSLLYRGYPVQELAAQCTFEEVAYLIWHGELPTDEQRAEFETLERSLRGIDPVVKRVIDELPLTAHPMDVVRTAVSVIGAMDPDASDASPDANLKKAVALFAQLPSIVAYDQRRRRDQHLIEPRDDLGYSANFLYMTFGEVPELVEVNAFDVSMILYAEHSFNASTFTARVITSTLSDLYSAVTGAVGALKGALHGGANEAVMHVFDEIGTADQVRPWLDTALAQKRKIMGFGHRVYKNGDSRVPTMKQALDTLIAEHDRHDLGDLYDSLESAMRETKNIQPNLDYPSGPAYHLMGFDTLTFTPLFVASRIVGWTAHIMEQLSANSLIRPLSEYVGPDQRDVSASETLDDESE